MQAGKIDIKSLLPEELAAALAEMGEKGFRAKQVFAWLGRGVESFDEMTDLSKALRAKLDERFFLHPPKVLRKQVSAEDGTIKYLWGLADGNAVETVVMRYRLPSGLRLLRLDHWRPHKGAGALGNAGRGHVFAEGIRPAHLEYRPYGYR